MMFTAKKALTTLGAAALVLQPTLAAAQQELCITETEIASMAIYAMPGLVKGLHLRCEELLSADGFLARDGDSFAGRYADLQDAAWPSAKSGFMKFVRVKASPDGGEFDLLASLPDEAVRPLLDALLIQKLVTKIAQKDCGKVERVMKAIAPVEPDVAGELIGVIAGLSGLKDPVVCEVEAL